MFLAKVKNSSGCFLHNYTTKINKLAKNIGSPHFCSNVAEEIEEKKSDVIIFYNRYFLRFVQGKRAGWEFTMVVFIFFNFICFVVSGVGYFISYRKVQMQYYAVLNTLVYIHTKERSVYAQ